MEQFNLKFLYYFPEIYYFSGAVAIAARFKLLERFDGQDEIVTDITNIVDRIVQAQYLLASIWKSIQHQSRGAQLNSLSAHRAS
jgi:hypothetical protein